MFDIDETPIDSFIALSRQLDAQELGVELNAEDMDALVAEIQDLQGYCGTLEAEVESLRRRCEKLKRDKKRLEWLMQALAFPFTRHHIDAAMRQESQAHLNVKG
uniref:Uncharacterized protein n=1 Tax=viral metagenome TaxID=1070528 RepID=A0A6M3XRR2_9ZZZZ